MNTPVSFELAKLLKEKGFEEISSNFYTNPRCKMFGIDEHGRYYPIKNKPKSLWISGNAVTLDSKHVYYAPTIAEVVMWLYKKHGIWISVDCDCYGILWYANLSVASEKNWDNIDLRHEIISASKKFPNEHNSPTEAYEAAIEYTLNNLI